MVDKTALLALSVQDRLVAITKFTKAEMLELVEDSDFVFKVSKEIADNKEFVKTLEKSEPTE